MDNFFDRVEAAAPGFVNFWVRREIFIKSIFGDAISKALEIASPKIRINLEFVSANPTGPLTMANGRGGFSGDVLARVLEVAGHDVTREYYINDAGVQIKRLGESILAALGLVSSSEEHYQGEYIKELAGKLKGKIIKKIKNLRTREKEEIAASEDLLAMTKRDPLVYPPKAAPEATRDALRMTTRGEGGGGKFAEEVGRMAAREFLAQIKKSLKNVGIKYDKWFSEYKDLRKKGELEKALALLRERGMVYEKDGAVWLRTKRELENGRTGEQEEIAASRTPRNDGEVGGGGKEGDDKDRVLVKSDGEATYFLADLAYHYDKFLERKFDKAIVIWGADHHGYVPRMKAGLEAMGIEPDKFQAIIVQLIRLVREGREAKMSKRKGEFVTLDDLIKEVGKDATRFFFLMQTPQTHMDFDLDLAKEKSVKNPVYYVQYAYVRCLSILKKAQKQKNTQNPHLNPPPQGEGGKLNSGAEMRLIKELVKLPDMILDTAEDFQVNRLIRYALELARHLHNFYEKERVIVEDKDLMEARVALVLSAKNIFERLFDVLGITKLKKM
jgi:arginyl-tRNA synthetase